MIREPLARKGVGAEAGFRWRGGEITRFEGFSDAVMAFAVTLLVVSLEVPRTFSDLLSTMKGFGAFAICFALLVRVWYLQYLFFRRYGLQDTVTLVLNAVLLFVVLFYVYPLKFLFSIVVGQIFGAGPMTRMPDGSTVPVIEAGQGPALMLIYGAGFVAVFLIFTLLFRHAGRRAEELGLSDLERFETRASVQSCLLYAAIGLLSMGIAALGGVRATGLSGWIYFLLGPVMTLHGAMAGKRRKQLMKASARR
jgi:hypothetical protein